MKHLLNCRECEWYVYLEGSSAVADIERESHERSIRNKFSEDACPAGSVAWASLVSPEGFEEGANE